MEKVIRQKRPLMPGMEKTKKTQKQPIKLVQEATQKITVNSEGKNPKLTLGGITTKESGTNVTPVKTPETTQTVTPAVQGETRQQRHVALMETQKNAKKQKAEVIANAQKTKATQNATNPQKAKTNVSNVSSRATRRAVKRGVKKTVTNNLREKKQKANQNEAEKVLKATSEAEKIRKAAETTTPTIDTKLQTATVEVKETVAALQKTKEIQNAIKSPDTNAALQKTKAIQNAIKSPDAQKKKQARENAKTKKNNNTAFDFDKLGNAAYSKNTRITNISGLHSKLSTIDVDIKDIKTVIAIQKKAGTPITAEQMSKLTELEKQKVDITKNINTRKATFSNAEQKIINNTVLKLGTNNTAPKTGDPTKPTQSVEALEPKGNFEIVDTYRGCDVVRYTVPIEAKYHYFLDCTDSMRNK